MKCYEIQDTISHVHSFHPLAIWRYRKLLHKVFPHASAQYVVVVPDQVTLRRKKKNGFRLEKASFNPQDLEESKLTTLLKELAIPKEDQARAKHSLSKLKKLARISGLSGYSNMAAKEKGSWAIEINRALVLQAAAAKVTSTTLVLDNLVSRAEASLRE